MRTTALVLVAALLVPAAFAGDDSASMTVSARVIARAVVDVNSQPDVVVTEADLARGYVDVNEPLAVRIRTNSRNGYLLQVANTSDAFESIELAFGTTSMNVADESWVARPYVPGGEIVNAQVRVRLSPFATAGRHPLPVQVTASPL